MQEQISLEKKPAPLWKNLDFLLLMGGQTVSTFGSSISGIAAPLLILVLTHSPAQAGAVASAETIPYILLSLIGGALVDRWNRKKAMVICDFGRGINLASLVLMLIAGHLTILQIYINAFIEGTFFVFFNSAETVSITRIVDKKQISEAYSVDQTCANVATFVGPLLGGALFTIQSFLPFLADVISYFISAISLMIIKAPFQLQRSVVKRNLLKDIRAGFTYLWSNRLFRFMALYGGTLYFVLTTQTLLVVVIGQEQKLPAYVIGVILTVASIGGIVGGALGAQAKKHLQFRTTVVMATWLLAFLWFLYALATGALPLVLIVAVLVFVTGGISFIDTILGVVYMSYRMSITPDEFRGRLNSTHRFFGYSLRPFGTALAGILFQYTGATVEVLLFTGVLLLLAVLVFVNSSIYHTAHPEAE